VNTLGSLDAKEVLEYAVYLGIEPAREPHLLWIAEEGMHAPLPEVSFVRLNLPPPPRLPRRPPPRPSASAALVVSAALGARQGFSEHTDANGEVYFFNAATQVLDLETTFCLWQRRLQAPRRAGSRWQPCGDGAGARAQESVWEHPLDRHYMDLVLEEPPRPSY
jgi:hypothetical protein